LAALTRPLLVRRIRQGRGGGLQGRGADHPQHLRQLLVGEVVVRQLHQQVHERRGGFRCGQLAQRAPRVQRRVGVRIVLIRVVQPRIARHQDELRHVPGAKAHLRVVPPVAAGEQSAQPQQPVHQGRIRGLSGC
jgi:hypothetical protein